MPREGAYKLDPCRKKPAIHVHSKNIIFVLYSYTHTAYLLMQPTNPQYSIGEKEFSSIRDLLDYYAEKQIAVTQNSEAILTTFVSNNFLSKCKDDYELTKTKIGSGAFGDVFEAYLISISQRVAVKTCKSSHTDVEKRKFLHEADILSHYNHPNIVKLIGVVADPLCIVMEHVGWTFRFFLKKEGT